MSTAEATAATSSGVSPAPMGLGWFCSMIGTPASAATCWKYSVWASIELPRCPGAITIAAAAPISAAWATWRAAMTGSGSLAPMMIGIWLPISLASRSTWLRRSSSLKRIHLARYAGIDDAVDGAPESEADDGDEVGLVDGPVGAEGGRKNRKCTGKRVFI